MDIFCQNVAETINKRGLGGVDIDAESGMPSGVYVNCFVNLIKGLKKYLDPDKIITYTYYTESEYDTEILKKVRYDIDIVHTMVYWLDFDLMKQEFKHYASLVGKDKVSIGVEANVTPLNEIKNLVDWLKSIKCDKMMLWSLTQDVKKITGKQDGTWSKTIYDNFN